MFQSGRQRTRHDEVHLCVDCIRDADCNVKPDYQPAWRFILTYCASFVGKLGSTRKNRMSEEE